MDERPPMTLPSALSLLRRFWYVPVALALLGIALGTLSGGDDTSDAIADTSVVLSGDPSLDLITAGWAGQVRVGPSATELVIQLQQAAADGRLGDATSGTSLSASAAAVDQLSIRVTAGSTAAATTASEAYVEYLRQLRQENAQQASTAALASIDVAGQALQKYIDGTTDTAQLPSGVDLVVVDRADAAAELLRLELFRESANQLAGFDGGVSANTTSSDAGSTAIPVSLLAVVFFALGIVLVLVFGPLDRRLRTISDVERITDTPIAGVATDDDRWPVEAALVRLATQQVTLVPVGARDRSVEALATSLSVPGTSAVAANLEDVVRMGGQAAAPPVLLVVRCGVDSARNLRRVDRSLRHAGITPSGVLLVGVARRDTAAAFA